MSKVRLRPETGMLFLDFFYQGKRCREQTMLPDNPANRQNAERLLQRVEREIRNGTFCYGQTFPNSPRADRSLDTNASPPTTATARPLDLPSLSAFTDTWFAENEPRWRISYRKLVRATMDQHILSALGARSISDITRADILALRAELATKPGRKGHSLSPSRINRCMMFLRMVLAEAVERFEYTSAFRNIKPLKVPKTDVQPFTLEEVHRLVASIRQDYRPYLIVRVFTGMRTGEINGLKWKYVDFENNLILVRETWQDGRVEYTKTDASQREIPMPPIVRESLIEQRRQSGKDAEYVFTTRTGLPIDSVNFTNRIWYPLLRYLELELRRPYQTRHTAATLMLASGESPEWIARVLGHSSTEMLFKVYSRFVPNLTRQDGRAFAGLIQAHMPALIASLTDVALGTTVKRIRNVRDTTVVTRNRIDSVPTKFGRMCQIQ